jgi:hypothetical protein
MGGRAAPASVKSSGDGLTVPIHDSVGAIVADVLRERDETDETFAEIRVSLEAFARHATAQLRGVAVNR